MSDTLQTTSSEPAATPTTGLAYTTKVATAAGTFMSLLSADQLDTLLYDFDDTDAKTTWSNLPVNLVPRNGIGFGALTDEQLDAAKAVADAILSDQGYAEMADYVVLNGYEEMEAIIAADDVLAATSAASGGVQIGAPTAAQDASTAPAGAPTGTPPDASAESASGGPPAGATGTGGGTTLEWGSDLYYIAFFGTPSLDEPWMVQIGGHHLAYNVTFDGPSVSLTPEFIGVEPSVFTVDGVTYAPMADEVSSIFGMFSGLDESQLAQAELEGTFGDVVVGAGQDGQFPATEGLRVSELSAEGQAAVVAAMERWVRDFDPSVADALMAKYQAELPDTYIAFGNSTDPALQGSYARIDGPSVWIELSNQGGIGSEGIHHHSVYRDKTLDYFAPSDAEGSQTASDTTQSQGGIAAVADDGQAQDDAVAVADDGQAQGDTVAVADEGQAQDDAVAASGAEQGQTDAVAVSDEPQAQDDAVAVSDEAQAQDDTLVATDAVQVQDDVPAASDEAVVQAGTDALDDAEEADAASIRDAVVAQVREDLLSAWDATLTQVPGSISDTWGAVVAQVREDLLAAESWPALGADFASAGASGWNPFAAGATGDGAAQEAWFA